MAERGRPALVGRALVAVAVSWVGLAAVTPGVASAHARLVASSPSPGASLSTPVHEVTLRFDDPVALVPHALTVTTDLGEPVTTDPPAVTGGGKILHATLQAALAPGGYVVAWRIRSDDGHIESSTFTFTMLGAAAGGSPGRQATPPAQAGLPAPGLPAPGQPVWPVLVAAGVALLAGLGAAAVVRRGLRLVSAAAVTPYPDSSTQGDRVGAQRRDMS